VRGLPVLFVIEANFCAMRHGVVHPSMRALLSAGYGVWAYRTANRLSEAKILRICVLLAPLVHKLATEPSEKATVTRTRRERFIRVS
jgi:hypothetical protein